MANPEITNNDSLKIPVFDAIFDDATLLFTGITTHALGTIMARIAAIIGTATADGGNTGNGTVTGLALAAGGPPVVGSWILTCTDANTGGGGSGVATADGGNTGNGTVTGITAVAPVLEGDYILTCTDANIGGTATGANVFTGTGNGTSDAIVPGTEAIEGIYLITCYDASVSGSEIFNVFDPNGVRLEDLTVGVAYSNNHFATTINDGGTDFIVGDYWTMTMTIAHGGLFTLTNPNGVALIESITLPGGAGGTVAVDVNGLAFTITDGATDFAADDFFTIAVTIAHGGLFTLTDPNGLIVDDTIVLPGTTLGTVTPTVAGLTFTITDGATDFAADDFFTLTVTAGSQKWVPFVATDPGDGSGVPSGILPEAVTSTGAGDLLRRMLIGGEVAENAISIKAGGTITDAIKQTLRGFGIIVRKDVRVDALDNS